MNLENIENEGEKMQPNTTYIANEQSVGAHVYRALIDGLKQTEPHYKLPARLDPELMNSTPDVFPERTLYV